MPNAEHLTTQIQKPSTGTTGPCIILIGQLGKRFIGNRWDLAACWSNSQLHAHSSEDCTCQERGGADSRNLALTSFPGLTRRGVIGVVERVL